MSNPNVNKKKVLFVITKGNFGGAQKYVFDLATNLPKSKYEPVVALGEGDLLPQALANEGVKTHKIAGLEREIGRGDWRALISLIKIIKETKPDTIHLNSSKIGFLGALASLYIKLISKNYNLKTVFTSHGWAFNERTRSAFSKFIYYVAHYFTVLICDTTIAVSERTKRDISFLPFIKNKIQVIHNGLSPFEPLPREEAREILAQDEKNKVIIFSLSELINNKGVDVALKALKMLPSNLKQEIIYCIAGSGEEKENLEKLTLDLGLQDQVKFLGFVEDAKLLLSGADIFLFPSRTENLPFAVLEAGLVAVPVISTNVGGIPEIITDMQSGILVHKENPKEICEALKYLLSNPQKLSLFGTNLKKVVTKNFSKTRMVRETVALY
jgi:glycosyltransferase involved in cell wall biosynthesis